MIATETSPSDVRPQRRTSVNAGGTLGGFIVTGMVVALCTVVMVDWDAGLTGDLLLAAAAVGVLFRTPHTVPVWAALTLLAATALALSLNGEALASRFADLAYYGLAVGCLWAIWDMALERLRWRLPGSALHEWLLRTSIYPYSAVVLLAGGALMLTAVASYLIGLAGLLLAVVAIVGMFLAYRFVVALWGGATLTLVTFFLVISGYPVVATTTGLLAAGAFLTALFWACWQALFSRYGLAWRGRGPLRSATSDASDDLQAAGSDRNTING